MKFSGQGRKYSTQPTLSSTYYDTTGNNIECYQAELGNKRYYTNPAEPKISRVETFPSQSSLHFPVTKHDLYEPLHQNQQDCQPPNISGYEYHRQLSEQDPYEHPPQNQRNHRPLNMRAYEPKIS